MGSTALVKMTGIVRVAAFSANAWGTPGATIAATLRATRSAARRPILKFESYHAALSSLYVQV